MTVVLYNAMVPLDECDVIRDVIPPDAVTVVLYNAMVPLDECDVFVTSYPQTR